MKITRLKTRGFRNLQDLSLKFSPEKRLFAFVGKNGQGKTNILEAIYISGLSKSFRNANYQEWIGWHRAFCHIGVETEKEGEVTQFEVIANTEPKQKGLKINGVKIPAMDFVGQLKVVFFSPDDLAYMGLAPKWRRHYMDVLLSQMSHDYLTALSRYQSILKQRNVLLKSIRDGKSRPEDLDVWDVQLVKWALVIYGARHELILELKPLLEKHYQSIAHYQEKIDLQLLTALAHQNEEACLRGLFLGRNQDVARGQTQFGPHRDDLQFRLNGRDMNTFASRGEWRSMVLALKFAELQIMKQKTGQSPIVLLDDVFSELDENRQRDLLNGLKEEQIFLTTTHYSFLEEVNLPKDVFEVKEGGVSLIV